MENRTVTHSTFVIERDYGVTPERVFEAFRDPVKKRRWFVEGGYHEVERHEMDFRIGGSERARYRFKAGTPLAGEVLSSETVYEDIIVDRRIVFAYTMSIGDNRISASLATIEMLPADGGTRLIFTEQGAYFEGADGPGIREEGWKQLLEQLAGELAG